jgi:DNA polymerase delta subunit 4
MSSQYGPYVGITRLERWERAKKWGLQPPEEVSGGLVGRTVGPAACCGMTSSLDQIKQILLTQQGEDEALYRESVVYGWV